MRAGDDNRAGLHLYKGKTNKITDDMRKVIILSICFFSSARVMADEGMWIPLLLKAMEGDMQAKGMKLSAEDIYSINKSSLKDAIVHFNGGCTAEVISKKGLILTNHHCGYGAIQSHSKVGQDYLSDGFWAMSGDQELKNPGMHADIIKEIQDVTAKVLDAKVSSADPMDRASLIADNIRKIEASVERDYGYQAQVVSFYYGNAYYLFIKEVFEDIRLVGAPPSSIGKFGADTDNWMWPRHTGDFSIFRIYAGKNNKPAKPSDDNKPYKPNYSLPISLEGVKPGDFTLVFGFPGSTQQYLSSYAVDFVMNKSNPVRIKMRQKALNVIDAAMKEDDKTRIQYSARQASISNAWKKWIGQTKGLVRLNALEKKRAFEAEFEKKVASSEDYKKHVGFDKKFGELYAEVEKYKLGQQLFIELYYYGPQAIRTILEFNRNLRSAQDDKKEEDFLKEYSQKIKSRYRNYNETVEKALFSTMVSYYVEALDPSLLPATLKEAETKYGGNWDKYTDEVFSKSQFTNGEKASAFVGEFDADQFKEDPMFQMANGLLKSYLTHCLPKTGEIDGQINALMKEYVKIRMELFPDKKYWPDANSTIRVAYGKVEGYEPKDGVIYKHNTTLEGVIEKKVDEKGDEFYVHPKLIDLYQDKNYGKYGENGEMPVCFTASNHTTGGNSGSPVFNGEGHLIGINFDRAWESTMSDIMYDPDRCRNIVVDIRYVLFIIDKYAGAKHLIKEMKFES